MMPRTESRCFQASESCAQCDWRLRRSLEKVTTKGSGVCLGLDSFMAVLA